MASTLSNSITGLGGAPARGSQSCYCLPPSAEASLPRMSGQAVRNLWRDLLRQRLLILSGNITTSSSSNRLDGLEGRIARLATHRCRDPARWVFSISQCGRRSIRLSRLNLELRMVRLEPAQETGGKSVHQHGHAGADAYAFEPALALSAHCRALVLASTSSRWRAWCHQLFSSFGQIDDDLPMRSMSATLKRRSPASLELSRVTAGCVRLSCFDRGGDAAALDRLQ